MIFSTLFLILPFSHVSSTEIPSCTSFGIDYRDGGFYSLEASSSPCFTAKQSFSGCGDGLAQNMLIDPNGNAKECNKTPMKPDGAIQDINCSGIDMSTGDWSILVISYNGAAEPTVHQRNFYLSVGVVSSTATTPTQFVTFYSMQTEAVTITAITSRMLDHRDANAPIQTTESNEFWTTAAVPLGPPRSVIHPSPATSEVVAASVLPRPSTDVLNTYASPVTTGMRPNALLDPSPAPSTISLTPTFKHMVSPLPALASPSSSIQDSARKSRSLRAMGSKRPALSPRARVFGRVDESPRHLDVPVVTIVTATYTTSSAYMQIVFGSDLRL